MFHFNRQNPDIVYADNRQLSDTLCDGRTLKISPQIKCDFRNLPFPDNHFYLVVFDPPHLVKVGNKSWLAKKYGKLNTTWQDDIRDGFIECMRVLKPNATLIFKWNEEQIKLSELLKVIPEIPIVGNKRAKTHWLVFMKQPPSIS